MEYIQNLFKQNPYLALSLVIIVIVFVIILRRSIKIIVSLLIILIIATVFILYKKDLLKKEHLKIIKIDQIQKKADNLRQDAKEKLYKKLNEIE